MGYEPERQHKIKLRGGTMDKVAFDEVILNNEYRLPPRMDNYVVIDVGAHCGYFALACLARGAKHVICVEPDRGNCEVLRDNVASYVGQVTLHNEKAAWRSDEPQRTHLNFSMPTPGHTCMGTVLGTQGALVLAVPLDQLIEEAGLVAGPCPVLLKLDCEGSEYGCLYTSELLPRCDVVLGESHRLSLDCVLDTDRHPGEPWGMDHAGLCNYLWSQGYRVRSLPNSAKMPGLNVLFWAALPGTPYWGELHPQPAGPGPEPATPTGEDRGVSRQQPGDGAPGEPRGGPRREPALLVP